MAEFAFVWAHKYTDTGFQGYGQEVKYQCYLKLLFRCPSSPVETQ